MTNQTLSSANTGDLLYSMRVLLFIVLLCMGYSLSRPTSASKTKHDVLLPATAGSSSPDQKLPSLPLWQRKASEKAVVKYAESQNKKWRRWNEAMFERSD